MNKTKQINTISFFVAGLLILASISTLILNQGFLYAKFHNQIAVSTTSVESYNEIKDSAFVIDEDVNEMIVYFDIEDEQDVLTATENNENVTIYQVNRNLTEIRTTLLATVLVILAAITASAIIGIKSEKRYLEKFVTYTMLFSGTIGFSMLVTIGVLSAVSRFFALDSLSINVFVLFVFLASLILVSESNQFTKNTSLIEVSQNFLKELQKRLELFIISSTIFAILLLLVSGHEIIPAATVLLVFPSSFFLALIIADFNIEQTLSFIQKNFDFQTIQNSKKKKSKKKSKRK